LVAAAPPPSGDRPGPPAQKGRAGRRVALGDGGAPCIVIPATGGPPRPLDGDEVRGRERVDALAGRPERRGRLGRHRDEVTRFAEGPETRRQKRSHRRGRPGRDAGPAGAGGPPPDPPTPGAARPPPPHLPPARPPPPDAHPA